MVDNVIFQNDDLATVPDGFKVETIEQAGGEHRQVVQSYGSIDSITSSAVSSGLTTATTLYTAGDLMDGLLSLTSMAASANGKGFISTVRVLSDQDAVIGAIRVWFFSESVTLPANNTAMSLSDADAALCVGHVTLEAPASAANNAFTVARNVNLDYECTGGGTTLYAAIQTLTTHTAHFAAADDLHLIVTGYRL